MVQLRTTYADGIDLRDVRMSRSLFVGSLDYVPAVIHFLTDLRDLLRNFELNSPPRTK